LKAELIRGLTLQVRLTNTHPSKHIASISSLPWFYRWDNGCTIASKMITFDAVAVASQLAPGKSATLLHQSFFIRNSNEGWSLHDAANDCLIQAARTTTRRSEAENFEFEYAVEDGTRMTLDLSVGIPFPAIEDLRFEDLGS
jgi:hypothetical protein